MAPSLVCFPPSPFRVPHAYFFIPSRFVSFQVVPPVPVTLASPLDSGRGLHQNKGRDTFDFWYDKYHVPDTTEGTLTASPVFHQASQTATTLSTPTPANPPVAADPGQDSGLVLEPPSSTPSSGSHLSSANAGIALASHGTVLMALTGLLATVLAF
ncbi:hypothetical protein DFH94DRAFT_692577 [Russula ochroleuca]|uniref:Uncharacterized protein n=1 Tax=Russula ochroleuca TaxID=152965 RepID=A0A9P5T9L1_9AGAM|nr:hypothetical protein DFH94DRAFT_692577 [Russula ochroleuca]